MFPGIVPWWWWWWGSTSPLVKTTLLRYAKALRRSAMQCKRVAPHGVLPTADLYIDGKMATPSALA